MSEQPEPNPAAMPADPDPEPMAQFRTLARQATRRLAGGVPRLPREELASLALEIERLDEPDVWDRYGAEGPVAVLEAEVARLLGKPAAVMFPSGTMAQQSVLRVWSDRSGSHRVAIPGQSHLLWHELDGPALLHGLRYERLSQERELPTAASLAAIPGQLAAVLLELPLRDAGYLLPSWDELVDFSAACRERGVPLHLDGARLWESQAYLGHDLSEIAGLADTVYVSFYKGLGGLSGAALAGEGDVVDEVRQWRHRHGGMLFSMLPYALSALRGLREELPSMEARYDRAVELAAAFVARGISVFPDPPHTNAFRIAVPLPPDVVMARLRTFMAAEKTTLTPPWGDSEIPGWSWTEFTVGTSTLEWEVDEAADLVAQVILAAND